MECAATTRQRGRWQVRISVERPVYPAFTIPEPARLGFSFRANPGCWRSAQSLQRNPLDYEYDQTHHVHADTFDTVKEGNDIRHAQVLAGWPYNTAQLPELLRRN